MKNTHTQHTKQNDHDCFTYQFTNKKNKHTHSITKSNQTEARIVSLPQCVRERQREIIEQLNTSNNISISLI